MVYVSMVLGIGEPSGVCLELQIALPKTTSQMERVRRRQDLSPAGDLCTLADSSREEAIRGLSFSDT